MTIAHGGVNGGRNHDGEVADNIWRTTNGDGTIIRGAQGADGEPMGPSDTAGTGDQGGGTAMSV